MTSKSFISELFVAVLVIAVSVLLFNPFDWWMSNQTVMLINVLFVALVIAFAAFVWRESARDEREQFHRQLASRVAYLAGVAVLVIGVIVEGLEHRVDAWLLLTLCVMVLAKIGGLMYGRFKH